MIPFFAGDNYQYWKITIRTFLRAEGLWALVEKGFKEPESEAAMSDAEKKRLDAARRSDASALSKIHMIAGKSTFLKISMLGSLLKMATVFGSKNNCCKIYDHIKEDKVIATVEMESTRNFPLRLHHSAFKAEVADDSWLWHKRYCHFNFHGLKFLNE
ncbi:hypothetical protein Salat_1118700 [Sesamum alatum]|uniref:DUF4219 domain-containing protein n=1 Tax=Sesamum alatum TaxID=300844 RepID=A0AAE2CT53_9LAMI|nr:hypothetical protein Salat_1118700 [Sesamum alatum]